MQHGPIKKFIIGRNRYYVPIFSAVSFFFLLLTDCLENFYNLYNQKKNGDLTEKPKTTRVVFMANWHYLKSLEHSSILKATPPPTNNGHPFNNFSFLVSNSLRSRFWNFIVSFSSSFTGNFFSKYGKKRKEGCMRHLKSRLEYGVCIILLLLLGIPGQGQGVVSWLDTSGQGPAEPAGYYCQSPFNFLGTQWNNPNFHITLKGFCGVVQDPANWVPGFGGGGADFKIVDVSSTYNYTTQSVIEVIKHQGAIIIQENLKCAKNPWVYGADGAGCTVSGQITNKTGVQISGPYPLSARYLSSSVLMALQSWEKTQMGGDPLADWNPGGQPSGSSRLAIRFPLPMGVIETNRDSFSLALNNIPSGSSAKKVQIHWQRLEKSAGGTSITNGGSQAWVDFDGPPAIPASRFPLTVPLTSGIFQGKHGLYRIQVKLEDETWWSPWQQFWIGNPTLNSAQLKKIALDSSKMEKALISTRIPETKKIGGPTPSVATLPSGLVAKTGDQKGLEPKTAPSSTLQPATPPQSQAMIPIKKADIVVESIAYRPAPLTAGQQGDLSITFRNRGQGSSDLSLKYTITCTVKSGGPSCLVANTSRPLNVGLPAGQTYLVTLPGAIQASAGKYDIMVKPEGGAPDSGKAITIEVESLRPIPGKIVTPADVPKTQPKLEVQKTPLKLPAGR
jgi:hypothetical protein